MLLEMARLQNSCCLESIHKVVPPSNINLGDQNTLINPSPFQGQNAGINLSTKAHLKTVSSKNGNLFRQFAPNIEVLLASVNISKCRRFPWLYSVNYHAIL